MTELSPKDDRGTGATQLLAQHGRDLRPLRREIRSTFQTLTGSPRTGTHPGIPAVPERGNARTVLIVLTGDSHRISTTGANDLEQPRTLLPPRSCRWPRVDTARGSRAARLNAR